MTKSPANFNFERHDGMRYNGITRTGRDYTAVVFWPCLLETYTAYIYVRMPSQHVTTRDWKQCHVSRLPPKKRRTQLFGRRGHHRGGVQATPSLNALFFEAEPPSRTSGRTQQISAASWLYYEGQSDLRYIV